MLKKGGRILNILSLLVSVCTLNGCGVTGEQVILPPVVSEEAVREESVPETGGDPALPAVSPDVSIGEVTQTPAGDAQLCVRFIDVGQADCALLECEGHYMLIDGGNREDSNLVYSVLQALGVTHLDMVVGSHAHEDHIGGIPGAFQYATAGMTLTPVTEYSTSTFASFSKYANTKGGGLTVPEVGDQYTLGAAVVSVLGVNSDDDTNETSIVMKVTLGDVSFLFTGDAERKTEQAILDSGADLSATVLKVGHHGSNSSTTYPFLRQIMPMYGVISVGQDNDYGHPNREVLDRLEAAEVDVLRTDLLGDIVFYTDGRTVTYVTGRNAASIRSGSEGSKPVFPPAAVPEPDGEEPAAAPAIDEQPDVSRPQVSQDSVQTVQPIVRPEPEAEPQPEPAVTVWVPESGKKYHADPDCSNMKNPSEVTRKQAEQLGYAPCKKCY